MPTYSATDTWSGSCGFGEPLWVDFYPSACSQTSTTCSSGCASDLNVYLAQKYVSPYSVLTFYDSSACTTPVYALATKAQTCVAQSSKISQTYNSDGSLTINFYQASASCSGSPLGSITVQPNQFSTCIQNYDGSYLKALIARPGSSTGTATTTSTSTSTNSPRPNGALNVDVSFSSLINLIWMILM